jgi:DNA-binding transcriptional LysR family regulator
VKAIADTRSLAGAAESLGVNHSTVFRRLGQIEQQLGSRLFERGRAGYALTACGEQMVELAERMGEDILPGYVGAAVPGLAQLSPPLPELEGELWLLTHPDLRNTARVRAFLDFCTCEIAQRRKVIECLRT